MHSFSVHYVFYTETQFFNIIDTHLRELYKSTRFTPEGAEWPPQQAKIFVSVALVHYKGKEHNKNFMKLQEYKKEVPQPLTNLHHQLIKDHQPRNHDLIIPE